LSMGRSQYEAP